MSEARPALPRHVVFDLDGTLVDSSGDLSAAVNRALADEGLAPLSVDEVLGFVGNGARRLIGGAFVHRGGTPDRIDGVLARFLAYYDDCLLERTRAYEGVPALLDALLARGVTLSVLTNKPGEPARRIVAELFGGRFERVIGGGDTESRKPDPEGLGLLVGAAAVAPEQALLVGDSVVDVRTGVAGGVPTCFAQWGFGTLGPDAPAPSFVADRPGAVAGLFAGA